MINRELFARYLTQLIGVLALLATILSVSSFLGTKIEPKIAFAGNQTPTPTPMPTQTPNPTQTPSPTPTSTPTFINQNTNNNTNNNVNTNTNNQSVSVISSANAQGATMAVSSPTPQVIYTSESKNPIYVQAAAGSPQPTATPTSYPSATPQVVQKEQVQVKELPRTGLPALGWGLASLIPLGLKLRKQGFKNEQKSSSPSSIWTERQFKL